MSPDRVIYSFVLGWAVLIAVLIALDWLGNPNRGGFRPKGDRPLRDRNLRRSERVRRRLENDASVRATLRDAYGASSLRLSWRGDQEQTARQLDDALVIAERTGDLVEVDAHEVITVDYTTISGDPLPNVDEAERLDDIAPHDAHETPADVLQEPTRKPIAWTVGADPLAVTHKGTRPAAATVRSRVWKNLAVVSTWDEENLTRLRAGRPPRRTNPITGRVEQATVDVETGSAAWGSEPLYRFGDD